jgi:hypothetical protein
MHGFCIVHVTGEEKFTYEEGDRGRITFEKFFEKHVPGFVKKSINEDSVKPKGKGKLSKPNTETKEAPKETPKEKVKEKETPKESTKETPKEAPKEAPKDTLKEKAKAATSKDAPKDDELSKANERINGLENKLDRMESLLLKLLEKKGHDEL